MILIIIVRISIIKSTTFITEYHAERRRAWSSGGGRDNSRGEEERVATSPCGVTWPGKSPVRR